MTVKGAARTQLFELAAVHPFRRPILELFKAERGVWEDLVARLRERLKKRAGVQAAWLYGSVARGEDTPAGDLDVALLVSAPDVGDKVREDLMHFEDESGAQVSVTALTSQDLVALQADDKWWSAVIRDSRVLKGAPSEAAMKSAKAHPRAA